MFVQYKEIRVQEYANKYTHNRRIRPYENTIVAVWNEDLFSMN